MFLFHKKKKNLCWDIDTLVQWNHVSTRAMTNPVLVDWLVFNCELIFLSPPQDPVKDTVALTFCYEGNTQVLNVHLPDYSGVLVDCLQGTRVD